MLIVLATIVVALVVVIALVPRGEPASANPLESITEVAAGGNHACAITDTGAALCWGDNHYGQLGDGTAIDRTNPVAVTGLSSGVVAIASGDNQTCAVLDTGAAKCWGYNRYGQLGNPQNFRSVFDPNPLPLDVIDLDSGVADVTAGAARTCVLLQSGGVQCWGWDRRGQLGDELGCPSFTCTVPRDVTGLTSGVAVVDVGVYHNCAALSTGAVKCWGQNDFGQLGAATGSPCVEETLDPIACAESPIDVSGLVDVVDVAGGGIDTPPLEASHTCAITSTGAAKCWGANDSGQLGDGQACGMVCQTPVDVTDLDGDPLTGIAEVSAGGQHTCARRGSDGAVLCWGDNAHGQLGNSDMPNDRLRATEICADPACEAFTGAAAISLGLNHSCALVDGSLSCWGSNSHGQVGAGGGCTPTCDTPVAVALTKGPLPDLTIVSMRIELETGGGCAFASTTLGLRIEFRNVGAAAGGPFVVDVDGAQQTVGSGLAAGASGSLWFSGHQFATETVAAIDATSLVVESDESNNTHTKILPVPTPPVTCTPTATPTPLAPTATPTPLVEEGDANCDSSVNSIDAALVLQRVAGLLATLPCPAGADANDDGQVNSIDAALILQYVAGLLPEL